MKKLAVVVFAALVLTGCGSERVVEQYMSTIASGRTLNQEEPRGHELIADFVINDYEIVREVHNVHQGALDDIYDTWLVRVDFSTVAGGEQSEHFLVSVSMDSLLQGRVRSVQQR